MRPRTKILGIVCLILIGTGAIAKNPHLPGAAQALGVGILLFVLAFSTTFLVDRLSRETRRAAKISYTAFFVASIMFMLAFVFQVLHLPGNAVFGFLAVIIFLIYIVFFSHPKKEENSRFEKTDNLWPSSLQILQASPK